MQKNHMGGISIAKNCVVYILGIYNTRSYT